MAKYYGENKIKDVEEDGDHLILTFKNGSEERISRKLFDVSVTNSKETLSNLWDNQVNLVTKEILEVLLEYDLKLEQLSHLVNKIQNSIQMSVDKANEKLWGKTRDKRTMSDVDELLTKTFIRVEEDGDDEESDSDGLVVEHDEPIEESKSIWDRIKSFLP